ncbi:MAG: aromatic ring-hydroxylating dioxygenase subunit alpha [Parvibaculaceae bacterium]
MSLQADLRNPELGYFDEGLNLSDGSLYATACRPFGSASMLPPVAYRSKAFRELENEKIWTRSWAAVGLLQQIPQPGDLLPMTLGMHGIHVQRQADGSIAARMNRHQHGGCRFVPEQCRSGRQTKCSITSCNYTRDADVMPAGENGEHTDVMYKFIGLTPERLVPIRCETWGPFILVNLDPEAEPLNEYFGDFPERLRLDLAAALKITGKQWLDFQCNWKMAGNALTRGLTMTGSDDAVELPANFGVAEANSAEHAPHTRIAWLFPNLLIAAGVGHLAVVLLQATGVAKTLARCFWLMPADAAAPASEAFGNWVSLLKVQGAVAENMHLRHVQLGTSSRPGTNANALPCEDNPFAHALNRFLAQRAQVERHYSWTAPIMDAAMLMRR